MFTGIIEAVSEVRARQNQGEVLTLVLARPPAWPLTIGQSIAVSGACLTVVAFNEETFSVELMPETLTRTWLGDPARSQVNLERALLVGGRFEGHIVQGHIDTTGTIVDIEKGDQTAVWRISYPTQPHTVIVPKGSIAVDGVSLTVVDSSKTDFSIALIPHTLTHTTFAASQVGNQVHLEFDILSKYQSNNQ